MTECSIIIVTFNGLHTFTIPCLRSVLDKTDEDFEIIVVDNNSNDGTQEYLRALSADEPRLKYILNATNRGFAGGNNDGLNAAAGDIIVLLNSDTQVAEGWLTVMRSALLSDHSIGLLGPVTNAAGNEQKIFTVGATPEEILAEGRMWTEASAGDRFETARLSFFCVAMRRDVFNATGPLDERYGLGFFEDDDYCIRVRKAGYSLSCCEDAFVYHRGSASFDKVPCHVKNLLKRNKKILEQKFGTKYQSAHPRELHSALAASYLKKDGCSQKTLFKVANKLHLIRAMRPKNLLKKWMFTRRIHKMLTGCGHADPSLAALIQKHLHD